MPEPSTSLRDYGTANPVCPDDGCERTGRCLHGTCPRNERCVPPSTSLREAIRDPIMLFIEAVLALTELAKAAAISAAYKRGYDDAKRDGNARRDAIYRRGVVDTERRIEQQGEHDE